MQDIADEISETKYFSIMMIAEISTEHINMLLTYTKIVVWFKFD